MTVPRWLRIQRLGLILFGGTGALLLIYALGFLTDVYLFFAYGGRELIDFYREMQGVNSMLLRNVLILIVGIVVLFMLGLRNSAAGLITFWCTALVSIGGIYFSARALIALNRSRLEYAALDLSSLDRYIERGTITYTASAFTYSLGMALYFLCAFAALFLLVTVLVNACTGHAEEGGGGAA
jgi:hypothetical protein